MHNRGEASILGQKLGPYYVSERLGQGGMGAVYLARDIALDRSAALKILLPRYADDPEFIARFQREARASAKLSHPNIVQIYAVDIESDPAYMAMEYVDGETLEARIQRGGAMKWQQALNVVSQVAAALACAHGAGIIHRDIKPANVLLDKHSRARVTDFGIAKVMGSQTKLTSTQHTVGSPCYMSPEQCGVGDVSPASDLFSLGIMLYEMLTGTVPFKGESSLAVMRQITTEDLPPVTHVADDVPLAVQQLLDSLAARELTLRYQTAQQVLEDLKALQAGAPMPHARELALRRAAMGPPSASAAQLTRSPTGPSPALKTSLVSDLLDDDPRPPVRIQARRGFEVPWMGLLITTAALLLVIFGALYIKGARELKETRPAAIAPEQTIDAIVPPTPTGALPPLERGTRPPDHLGPLPPRPPEIGPRPQDRLAPGGFNGPRPGDRPRDPNRPPPPSPGAQRPPQ